MPEERKVNSYFNYLLVAQKEIKKLKEFNEKSTNSIKLYEIDDSLKIRFNEFSMKDFINFGNEDLQYTYKNNWNYTIDFDHDDVLTLAIFW